MPLIVIAIILGLMFPPLGAAFVFFGVLAVLMLPFVAGVHALAVAAEWIDRRLRRKR